MDYGIVVSEFVLQSRYYAHFQTNTLGEGWKRIQDDDRQGRLTVMSSPERVDTVNAIILAEGKDTIVYISEQLRISVGRVHQIIYYDLEFSKVSCRFTLNQKQWKSFVSFVGNSCHTQLTVQPLLRLISPFLTPSKISAWDKVFKRWWSEKDLGQMAENPVQTYLSI